MTPEDIAWRDGTGPFRAGGAVRVRWLGTAGFAIEHAGHVLCLDPYLTRASLATCVLGRVRSDEALLVRELPRVDAIVLGHTHFDHALDAPAIARRTGARVFGSRSAVALCRAAGLPETQIVDAEATREAEVGPFALRFRPSAHSRFLLGRVPFPGDIADCDHVPTRIGGFRCGAVFGVEIRVGGRRLFHVGSAELVEGNLDAAARGADLVLACVAGWTSTPRYPERLLAAFDPGAVLLHHWDNFLKPFERPAQALPAMRLPSLAERLGGAVPVGTLALGGAIVV